VQVPYAAAYPDEHLEIHTAINDLLDELQDIRSRGTSFHDDPEIDPLFNYYSALRSAYTNIDLSRSEELWAAVDEKWMAVTGAVQPVHAMEFGYEDRDGKTVMPENRVTMFDSRHYEAISKQCQATRTAIIKHLQTLFPDSKALKGSIGAMEITEVNPTVDAVFSGVSLHFRYAGQTVPNREEVAFEYGRKANIDMDTIAVRLAKRNKLVSEIFGEEVDDIVAQITVEEVASIIVGGHEVAHAAFVVPGTKEKMGGGHNKKKVEEK